MKDRAALFLFLLSLFKCIAGGAQSCTLNIPRIVHFVFHDWNNCSSSCPPPKHYLTEWRSSFSEILGDSWEVRLWDRESSRQFIDERAPYFIKIYDSYPLPIQRVDAVRYFILKHIGGIYADLDYQLLKSPEVILSGASVVLSMRSETEVKGVQNSFMASIPGHPFWDEVIKELMFRAQMPVPNKGAHGDFIMLTTGPTFLSDVLREYRNRDGIVLLPASQVFPFTFEAYEQVTRSIIEEGSGLTPNGTMCQEAARAAAKIAAQKGAIAIHHFVGAWTANGPRCSFVNG